ncbi:hypothetical protein FHR70_001514 [Microvirga lupini]|uniref:Uncharacterized protein n=1 Tax=Microvirga lupini TaxID=420324 RepID=A0A7W4VJS9_9HYPH|nr:hypothetical protein [Microvirga lupini]MBB3018460.1 hypothetical protein [Microvirga lupini]
MSADRELLELAAKAAGREVGREDQCDPIDRKYTPELGLWCVGPWAGWFNPLNDDGDALRLAVKLNLLIDCYSPSARPLPDSLGWFDCERGGLGQAAAVRRAIVRVAAEIGRSM